MWDVMSTKNDNFDSQVGSDRCGSALSFSLVSELVKTKQDFTAAEPPHCCVIRQVTEIRINFFKKILELTMIECMSPNEVHSGNDWFQYTKISKSFPQRAC